FIIYTRLVSTILTLAFPFLRLPLLASIDYIVFTSFRVFALPAQQALMMTLVSGRRRATASGTNQTARLLPSALSTLLSGFLLSVSVIFPFALAFVTIMTNLYLYYRFFWNVPEARERKKISARIGSEG
ncbi:MFS transporter, partial [Sulfolobus sp. F3]